MMTGAPGWSALADRMRWLQARTRVLSENVANADTPRFAPRDLAAPPAPGALAPTRTHASHVGGAGADAAATRQAARIETRPGGNAVNLEDEMMKLSETQLEYQMMAGLYQRGLATLKTALGKRG